MELNGLKTPMRSHSIQQLKESAVRPSAGEDTEKLDHSRIASETSNGTATLETKINMWAGAGAQGWSTRLAQGRQWVPFSVPHANK